MIHNRSLSQYSSLGERALGCGRWSSDLTESSQSDVRSLARASLGRCVKRGGLLSKPKALSVNGSKNPLTYCFGRAKQAPERTFQPRADMQTGSAFRARCNTPVVRSTVQY